jgi:transposase
VQLDIDLLTLDHESKTYKAVKYTLNICNNLCRYLYYPDATIDNNAAERVVRPTKLGMKNWLFVGHPKAGQRSAIIYTIVQNCKTHGVDPQAYLQDVLERLPHMKSSDPDLRLLQPKLWKQNRASF